MGGGYTGMWTALLAKEADPGLDVLVLEGDRIAEGASGRNGGFMAASITHGFSNGLSRWPDEMAELTRQGQANLDAIEATIARYGMDVDFARTGELDVATEDHQVAELAELPELVAPYGEHAGVPRRAGDPGHGGLAAVPGQRPQPRRRGPGRSGEAELGAGAGRALPGRAGP